jgi:hypothetical protein
MIAMLVLAVIIAGIATPMLVQGTRQQMQTGTSVLESRLLFIAESGLDYNVLRMEKDPVWIVKANATDYPYDGTDQEYDSPLITLSSTGASTSQAFRFSVQYTQAGTPVTFSNRSSPTEGFNGMRVRVTAASGRTSRTVVAYYVRKFGFRGALVSDMIPITGSAKDKSGAQKGNVTLDGNVKRHAIFGDILANGVAWWTAANVRLTPANAGTYLLGHSGDVQDGLAGTANEIPDFTNIGGTDQLFDFNRFQAAAAAGAGAVYANINAFKTACVNANALSQPLEGIQFVNVNPATEGGSPKFDWASGINIKGCLVIKFATGTSSTYKIVVTSEVKINAGDLSTVNLANESTYTTGYPPVYTNAAKKPSAVNIAPTYTNFTATEDYPAVMFNNGIVDYHGKTNICGVVYGPSFVEIENKTSGNIQYFNGAIYAGGGIFLEGNSSGYQAVRYDGNAVDSLTTLNNKGQKLTRIGFAIEK